MPEISIPDYPFKLPNEASTLISRFGFSQKEASVFYGVRLDTIKKWISGKMAMPDDLVLESYNKLARLQDFAALVASAYNDLAIEDDGEHMAQQYISLPTVTQMRRGFMPVSKGFYESLFADIAAHAYSSGPDDFCYVVPEAPDEEIGTTNFWIRLWVEQDMQMELCIEREDSVARFDVDFYSFLKTELSSWTNVQTTFSGGSDLHPYPDEVCLDIPYSPDWYGEAHDLTDEEVALAGTSVRIAISIAGSDTFDDIAGDEQRFILLVEDDEIRPMMEAHEGPEDADLCATNENLALILREVFGSRQALLSKAAHQ